MRYVRCPYKHKYQLADWFAKRFNVSKSEANKHSKEQLYAIYYRLASKICGVVLFSPLSLHIPTNHSMTPLI